MRKSLKFFAFDNLEYPHIKSDRLMVNYFSYGKQIRSNVTKKSKSSYIDQSFVSNRNMSYEGTITVSSFFISLFVLKSQQ